MTIGFYDDKRPGEIFITISKQGTTISGLFSIIAMLMSLCLQYGVPVDVIATKLAHTRFEPSGTTGTTAIPHATSIPDYIAHWLHLKFGKGTEPLQAEAADIDESGSTHAASEAGTHD